jgi:large subunit ribosomal protein L17
MRGLFTSERVVTTVKKAKVTSRYADKVITLAKQNDLSAIRQVEAIFQDKNLVHKLFHEIGPRFTDRNGGYTRVLRYKVRRGDGTEMAILELTEKEIMSPEERAPKTKSAKKKTPEKTVAESKSSAVEQQTAVTKPVVIDEEQSDIDALAQAASDEEIESPEDTTDEEEEKSSE